VFLDEVKVESRGVGCTVRLLLGSSDEEEGNEIVQVLDDPVWKSAAISRALNKRGHEISADSIGRHRRRADGTGCKCPL